MTDSDGTRSIVEMRFGSHLYGTSTPASDTDLKRIHLPAARDILLQRVRPVISTQTKVDERAKNGAEDVDMESFALHKFLALVAEGQTVAMDMLFAPDEMLIGEPDPTWRELQANAHRLVSRQCKSFIGYCRQQANKYGVRGSRVAAAREGVALIDRLVEQAVRIAAERERPNRFQPHLCKLREFDAEVRAAVAGKEFMQVVEIEQANGSMEPHLEICDRKAPFGITLKEARGIFQRIVDMYGQRALQAERNEGVDWKALSHAVRVGRQAVELLETGRVTFPRPEAAHLLAIKTGAIPYRPVAEEIEHLFEAVERAAAVSTLPDQPDFGWIDAFVVDAYWSATRRV